MGSRNACRAIPAYTLGRSQATHWERVGPWQMSGTRRTLTGKCPTECDLDGARPTRERLVDPMSKSTHDPLCDWWTEQCQINCPAYHSLEDSCGHQTCVCGLVAKVRSDQVERDVNKVKAAYSDAHVDDWGVQVLYIRSAIDALRGGS